MVVMVTPVAFASIGYKTYIIFAVINAFMVPSVYFFYPETAYRSLEEMVTLKVNPCREQLLTLLCRTRYFTKCMASKASSMSCTWPRGSRRGMARMASC